MDKKNELKQIVYYCNNCKYFETFDTEYGGGENCNFQGNIFYTKKNYRGDFHKLYKRKPNEINKKNNCKGYKRKLWKLWVK
jgi:hypothetical protein